LSNPFYLPTSTFNNFHSIWTTLEAKQYFSNRKTREWSPWAIEIQPKEDQDERQRWDLGVFQNQLKASENISWPGTDGSLRPPKKLLNWFTRLLMP